MLEEWATQQAMYTVIMSAEIEQQEWATKEIRAAGHTCWSYPTNHADMHLAVRTDNFPHLEPQAQEQESNPEPGSPRPPGLRTARPPARIFLGLSPRKLMLKKKTCPEK
ncbi:hypothetical protein DSO57_1026540 [Entomophthora muscae]|uniref:Uncharacterized protein n=1 Tax=Entomophthora muscae TaxID=34485 RepID=A0ACC2U0G8_9FUNG|nr:hypothetical protein DSO57_1026540 [Entomophthora muscae]